MRLLLVHSPLVGPATWGFVADELTSLGHEAEVPDLRHAAQSGDPRQFIAAAQSAITADTETIVGHSGAGFFLPSIADQLPVRALVFVDAGLPPLSGTATASADFIDQLRSMAVDEVLPRWSRWWGDDVMSALVPDPQRRLEVESEVPTLPLAFYEARITIPGNWSTRPGGYVLLSESYRADREVAASLGWPTLDQIGGHLDIVNRPDRIARALITLASTDR